MSDFLPLASTLTSHIDGVFDNRRFELLDKAYGYKAIHMPVSECPRGPATGCAICSDRPNSRKGFHPRLITRDAVLMDVQRRADNQPEILPHRWRVDDVSISVAGVPLTLGVDYVTYRREIRWLSALAPLPGVTFSVAYTGYHENTVNMQHATGAMIGLARRAEQSLNLVAGNLDQGQLALSIPPSAEGFMAKSGDRWLPADALMRFTTTIIRDRANWDCRHLFVDRVVAAFGLDRQNREVQVPISYNAATQRFESSWEDARLPEQIVVEYDACPIYFVYLDQGEFRAPMGGQDHHRLVILSREEQSA